MFEGNSIIKASAGTGKTFALATRVIRLMMIDHVRPETIVALTFSRAAAQEIYTKILERLCHASTDDLKADREWKTLLEDFKEERIAKGKEKLAVILSNPPAHGVADFRKLLRRLVDTQHLGSIATLDSFILRIVRNFPKEMGFQNAVSVLDSFGEVKAVEDAMRVVLAKTDESTKSIAEAFSKARGGDYSRQCLSVIGTILTKEGWRNFVLANPECAKWTVDGMCAELGVKFPSECPDLSEIPIADCGKRVSPEESFIRKIREYDGTTAPFFIADNGVDSKMARFFWENPTAEEYAYDFYNKHYVLECGASGAKRMHDAVRHAMNLFLRHQLEIVKAKIDLSLAVEREYEKMTRRMGKLTFSDFTKYSAEEEFSARGIALKNVEFRFDSKFDHWALDEFQDTSELQWRCLKELVMSAAEAGCNGEDRSVMAVGDMKQSIYTWRGASAKPFEDIAAWPEFVGASRDLSLSYRYGPTIAAFVNSVFGRGNCGFFTLVPASCKSAVDQWLENWTDHVSHEAQDYVKVVEAVDDESAAEEDATLRALGEEVGALWKRHEDAKSTESVGILVRTNDNGYKTVEYLRSKGLRAVFEGNSPATDSPIVQAVIAMLKLSEHPTDAFAWQTAGSLIDVRSVLLPECSNAEEASAEMSRRLTHYGLSRTLKDFCQKLRTRNELKGGFATYKLTRLVDLAVMFEANSQDEGIDAFIEFVGKSSQRENAASSSVIRVLTIHRSKGLGFDHVFVPLFGEERWRSAIDSPKSGSPVSDGGNWAVCLNKKGEEMFNERMRKACAEMSGTRFLEALRTYYVALTRAKRSMCVLLPPDDGKVESGLLMRDLIASAIGNVLPYEAGTPPEMRRQEKCDIPMPSVWPAAGKRLLVERVSPSRGTQRQVRELPASILFDTGFGVAARRGIEVHAAYQAIEWIDRESVSSIPAAFLPAFVKPSAEATLWRERSYEIFDGKRWESGQFDRVVFVGSGNEREAVIYDFKTNACGDNESAGEFAERMRAQYAFQMGAYRHALNRLTGIPIGRIKTCLLLNSTEQAVFIV